MPSGPAADLGAADQCSAQEIRKRPPVTRERLGHRQHHSLVEDSERVGGSQTHGLADTRGVEKCAVQIEEDPAQRHAVRPPSRREDSK
jgi:hypothetical protein